MSTIASNKQRASDLKLIAIITTIVILCGFFIAGSILFLSRGGKTGPCGTVNGGSLTDLVPRAATAPSYVAVSGGCRYWLPPRPRRPGVARRRDGAGLRRGERRLPVLARAAQRAPGRDQADGRVVGLHGVVEPVEQ